VIILTPFAPRTSAANAAGGFTSGFKSGIMREKHRPVLENDRGELAHQAI
jgi:hypothetical protein